MLKRFVVENFLSFENEAILDLTAGRTELNDSHCYKFDKDKILKTAIVYGANASGKSNLIKAIDFARKAITDGLSNVNTYKKYFRLNKIKASKVSRFEFEIEINGDFFSYGFGLLLREKKIHEEWLYQLGKTTPTKIFERKNNNISLSKTLEKIGRFKVYQEDMQNQNNRFFLAEVAAKALKLKAAAEINLVYKWLNENLVTIYPDSKFDLDLEEDVPVIELYKKYLTKFDTGIIDVEKIEKNFDDISKKMPEEVKIELEKKLDNKTRAILKGPNNTVYSISKDKELNIKVTQLGFIHGNSDYTEAFESKDESDGTIRLLDLIPAIGLFASEYTFLIDEIERSLHPKLTQKFFELFYEISNQKKAQIITSTHESTLLNLDLIRRDEIWFVEKSKEGASKLYSLDMFKERYDKKVEKAYLLGRYGAIPLFKDFSSMIAD